MILNMICHVLQKWLNVIRTVASIKLYISSYSLIKGIHQIDCKNEWLLLSASAAAKFGLVFVLTLEEVFS